MENDLYFYDNSNYNVFFDLNNIKLYGTIFFSSDSPAYLEITTDDIMLSLRNECPDSITCHYDGRNFRLIKCKKIGLRIYPKLIILDLPEEINTFESFEININELNVILHDGYFTNSFAENKFTSHLNESNFKINITGNDKIDVISDSWDYNYNISHTTDIITQFTQRHIISVNTKKPLELEQLISESRHIRLIFSLLTLMKVNINYLWVTHNNNRFPAYYPVSPKNVESKIEWTKSLIRLKGLNNVQWTSIFNNSYKKEFSEKLWIRFDGMFSYNSYWEYEVLAYMSILDFYLTLKFGKSGGTFRQKYLRQLSELSEQINNYIGLPEDRFKRLLTIRNGAAHCNPNDLEIEDDISILMVLKRRLIILLNYLALRDLGISDHCYAESVYISFNSIVMNACTNKKWLKKITGDIKEIFLNRSDYNKLIKCKPSINEAIFTEHDKNIYKFNEKGTLKLKADWREFISTNSNICTYIDNNISIDKKIFSTQYIHQVHIHTNGEKDFIEMHGVYFLNRKDI